MAGARDVGLSPAIIGLFPRKEAALVEVCITLIYIYFLILGCEAVFTEIHLASHAVFHGRVLGKALRYNRKRRGD